VQPLPQCDMTWKPVDENTPRDRDILMRDRDNNTSVVKWCDYAREWRCRADGHDAVEHMSDFGTSYFTFFTCDAEWMDIPT
jgi:hypothetical protein